MDIREMLRHLRAGESNRAVAQYRQWAEEQELLKGPLPSLEELQGLVNQTLGSPPPPQNRSSVEPHRETVIWLRQEGVEAAAIYERLKERGYSGSYSSVYRFVRALEPRAPEVTVRVETPPGEEAQVDFGYAGKMIDPRTGKARKAWAFVMTLSWSRHQYVQFVFDQTKETWLHLHRNALAFFGGVPRRIVIDNLKAGVAKACWHEPQAQQSYRECAEHYGFLIAPCRPRTPEHKGKVEQGGVHYVKRNFLGGREVTTLDQANRDVKRWLQTTAGQRVHGTTREKPLERFQREYEALQPLPRTPYDLAVWKQAKLHRDCYLIFDQAYYSAPYRLVGQQLWVRGGSRDVQIYTTDHQLVATHSRSRQPGHRATHLHHLPDHKVPGLILTRESCRRQASEIGPATQEVVDGLLDHRPEDRLRTAGRLLRLADRFCAQRLEAACGRALQFSDPSYMTIKRILEQELDAEKLPSRDPLSVPTAFVRTATELVGHLKGVASWR